MDKKSERARVLKERNALSTAKRGELNHALCSFLSDFLDSVKVQTIGAFLPIGSEPDISEVLKNWLRAGAARQVFLPEDRPLQRAGTHIGSFFRTSAPPRPLRSPK